MTNQIDHIVEHLFDKKRLDDVSVYELERFIATHPYFAAGHFLLAKKKQASDPGQYKEYIATTALYYSNPLWLQWLLDHDSTSYQEKTEETKLQSEYHAVIPEESSIEPNEQEQPETITHPQENGEGNEEVLVSEIETLPESQPSSVSEVISNPEHSLQHEEAVADQEIGVESVDGADFSEEPSSTLNERGITNTETESGEAINIPETPAVIVSDQADQHEASEESTLEENPYEEQMPDAQIEPGISEEHKAEEESRASAASIGRTLTTAALIPTRAEIEKNEFTFEPYHTIDYFASQGIRLQQSDLSKDKFGKQLKSFTEWLRSMKRLPQAAAENSMDEATQQSIQNIAEHSFEEKEIVTETMAEVWIKQGNKEKAIDTLLKLSLLNPSKSHYFAAKIEQLKAS